MDFVCNNLAESFNDKISGMKTLAIVILLDAIRQCIMVKIDLRQRICARNFLGHKIVPKVVMLLNARTRAMRMIKMRMVRSSSTSRTARGPPTHASAPASGYPAR